VNLSKEPQLGCALVIGQSLHRFLQSVGFLLAEPNASPLVDSTLSHHVLHKADWRCLLWLFSFFASYIDSLLWEVLAGSGGVFCLVQGDLAVSAVVLQLEEVIQVLTLFDQVRNLFKALKSIVWVMDDQLFEHFL